MKPMRESVDPLASALVLAALAAAGAIAAAESWRAAMLALAAAGSVAATRIRFTVYVALGLLLTIAAATVLGPR